MWRYLQFHWVWLSMARPLRLHVPGGFYHITLRGNHRLPVFFTEQDRCLLDEIVAEVIEKLSARVHAYCWMTNHLHLLLQVSNAPAGRVVRQIASRYARTVQARLATTGHLFERRYHGVLVDVDEYLLTLVRYIHLNPVKAGLAEDPSAYRWSSHQDYLGRVHRPWVTTGFVMNALGQSVESAAAAYRALMQLSDRGTAETDLLETKAPRRGILGSEEFVNRVTATKLAPTTRWQDLGQVVAVCCARFDCSPEQLASASKARGLAVARAWLSHEAVNSGLASRCAVARRLNRCESAIRQLMQRYPSEGSPA
jgi:REP element-mobilizing transposase RayT